MIKHLVRAIRPIHSYLKKIGKWKVMFTKRYLVFTNTGLSIVTSVVGDFIQQTYQRVQNDQQRTWDAERSAKIAAVGLALGPVVHYWYIYLDTILPGKARRAVIKKVCLDQFIFSPIAISMFLLIVGIMEHKGLEELKGDFAEVGGSMFLTDMAVWTPAQIVNFKYVSPRYRVLYDNFISLMSSVFYSYLRFE